MPSGRRVPRPCGGRGARRVLFAGLSREGVKVSCAYSGGPKTKSLRGKGKRVGASRRSGLGASNP
eukprot:scaffold49_cov115-Isochrysis_galbana.AAC.8